MAKSEIKKAPATAEEIEDQLGVLIATVRSFITENRSQIDRRVLSSKGQKVKLEMSVEEKHIPDVPDEARQGTPEWIVENEFPELNGKVGITLKILKDTSRAADEILKKFSRRDRG